MKSLASAVRGKTARACDSCVKKRAHWYCAADDAFLCHSCDGLVHSANPLSRRHKRVLLPSANVRRHSHASSFSPPRQATWHKGFTRKARTPRGGKKNRFHELVPEISTYDHAESYEEERQVPVMNLMLDKQCFNKSPEKKMMSVSFKNSNEEDDENAESCLNSLLPTDLELAQFTADVETLLSGGMEQEYHPMEEVGFNELSKIEKEEVDVATREVCDLVEADDDDESSQFKISFDCESSHKKTVEEEKDNKEDVMEVRVNEMSNRIKEEKKEKALSLRLDYETVISTWGGQGIPWSASEPSEIDLDMGKSGSEAHHHNHSNALGLLHKREVGDGEREAKVSRYREKRRTRLFTKKIRYEVRKLNAEKRPRMKGRFVKRSTIGTDHA